jgi:hypothetical protein
MRRGQIRRGGRLDGRPSPGPATPGARQCQYRPPVPHDGSGSARRIPGRKSGPGFAVFENARTMLLETRLLNHAGERGVHLRQGSCEGLHGTSSAIPYRQVPQIEPLRDPDFSGMHTQNNLPRRAGKISGVSAPSHKAHSRDGVVTEIYNRMSDRRTKNRSNGAGPAGTASRPARRRERRVAGLSAGSSKGRTCRLRRNLTLVRAAAHAA